MIVFIFVSINQGDNAYVSVYIQRYMERLSLGKLKLTTIRLDDEDLEKAQKLGINISQVCRNAVKEAIRRMEGPTYQDDSKTNSNVLQNNQMVRGVGLEPTKAFAIGASVLLLRPSSDIPAVRISENLSFNKGVVNV